MKVDPDELRQELRKIKREKGKDYTKARYLAERMGYTSTEIGWALRKLRDQGDVEQWGAESFGSTWRITLDEEGDDGGD